MPMADEMYGIASVLDDEHQDAVWRLWEDIERKFGVSHPGNARAALLVPRLDSLRFLGHSRDA